MSKELKTLSYEVLKELKYEGYLLKEAPERVLQFGEGNFLRAFADYFIDILNEKTGFNSKVVMVQPIEGGDVIRNYINEQEGLYTLILRGNENGHKVSKKRVISCVSRCLNPYSQYETVLECAKNPELRYIVCNTTEAGIRYDESCRFDDAPAESYPAKLTRFMYERYKAFGNKQNKGFVILACELIDDNGKELEKCVLKYAEQWQLKEEFKQWIKNENIFCSTLVDRIVTGYPRKEAEDIVKELGYRDNLIDTGEIFGFWVIEGPDSIKKELSFEAADLPVIITDNHKPYKERKVRILNGAHTTMALGACLAGKKIVRECMEDSVVREFMNKTIYEEIIPTLSLPKEELKEFAASVTDRFNNPFIDHELTSIALNSTSKWKARVLPSLKKYMEINNRLPRCIVASMAFYIEFCCGSKLNDDRNVQEFYNAYKEENVCELVEKVLANKEFWGEDLTKLPGFKESVEENINYIRQHGAYENMKKCII